MTVVDASSTEPIVLLEIAGHRLGLAAASVREIVRAVAITPLPNAPSVVEGVISVRGTLVVVFDIRRRLGWPARPLDPSDHFVLARAADREVALRADRALDLVRCAPADIDRAGAVLVRGRHVAGVAKLPDGLILIHDVDTFLTAAEGEDLDAALATGRDAGGVR